MSCTPEKYLSPDQSSDMREARRVAADRDWQEVARVAAANGLSLHQKNDNHYQLTPWNGLWILNIYPSNCRLYADKNRKERPPFLELDGTKWTLRDVVDVAILQVNRKAQSCER